MKVELDWITPDADERVAKMARVSNPANQDNKATAPRLIRYLIRKKHWSPFEMVNACVRIEAPRDITRQILRHRSFSFQEFSGRYADYEGLLPGREGRIQDYENRQNSLPIEDAALVEAWQTTVSYIQHVCWSAYRDMRDRGIAKEVARAILPEGLVPTTLYMNGSIRSWIHYWSVRCTPETQKEHRLVAEATRQAILPSIPQIAAVLDISF